MVLPFIPGGGGLHMNLEERLSSATTSRKKHVAKRKKKVKRVVGTGGRPLF